MAIATFLSVSNPRIAALFAALIAIAAATVGCSQANPISEEEYLKWCGSLDFGEPLAREAETWGNASSSIALTLEQAEAFNPPERLRRFHSALKDVIESGLDVAKSEPESQRLEEEVIPTNERVAANLDDLTREFGNLPAALKEALESTGCSVVF